MKNNNNKTIIVCIFVILFSTLLFYILYRTVLSNGKKSNITNKNVNEIELIIGVETRTDYYLGDEYENPSIYAKYNDTIINVTNSSHIKISGFDSSQAGVQTIQIKYDDGQRFGHYSYNVYIHDANPISIYVNYSNSKLIWGQRIDKSKLTVELIYSDKTRKLVDNYILKYNSMPDEYGGIDVYVLFEDFKTKFNVNVVGIDIDEQYSLIENEAKLILARLGKKDATCPMDYTFSISYNGNGVINIVDIFEGYSEENVDELISFITFSLFSNYFVIDGPIDSTDLLVPSKKIVYYNEEFNIKCRLYIMNDYSGGDFLKYSLYITSENDN